MATRRTPDSTSSSTKSPAAPKVVATPKSAAPAKPASPQAQPPAAAPKTVAATKPARAAAKPNVPDYLKADSPAAKAHVSEETRRAMIAESAYLRAERRGFAPGGEVDDWCAAEREVDALLNASTGKQLRQ